MPYYGAANYRKYFSNCSVYNRYDRYVIFPLEEKRNNLFEGLVKFLIMYKPEKTNVKSTIKRLKRKKNFFNRNAYDSFIDSEEEN